MSIIASTQLHHKVRKRQEVRGGLFEIQAKSHSEFQHLPTYEKLLKSHKLQLLSYPADYLKIQFNKFLNEDHKYPILFSQQCLYTLYCGRSEG